VSIAGMKIAFMTPGSQEHPVQGSDFRPLRSAQAIARVFGRARGAEGFSRRKT